MWRRNRRDQGVRKGRARVGKREEKAGQRESEEELDGKVSRDQKFEEILRNGR